MDVQKMLIGIATVVLGAAIYDKFVKKMVMGG